MRRRFVLERGVLGPNQRGEVLRERFAVLRETASRGRPDHAFVALLHALRVQGEPDLAGRDVDVSEEKGNLRAQVPRTFAVDDFLADVDDFAVRHFLVVRDGFVSLFVLFHTLREVLQRLVLVFVAIVGVLQFHDVVVVQNLGIVADALDEDQRHVIRRLPRPPQQRLPSRSRRIRRVEDRHAACRLRVQPLVHFFLARHRQLFALAPGLVPGLEKVRARTGQAAASS
mmetsp:Transcript_20357/g.62944  ORF Transcript_20357/g.62944 Transcript_20357/m.62944 type:complete len:228 (-) Transcript_20357:459-1142(-)